MESVHSYRFLIAAHNTFVANLEQSSQVFQVAASPFHEACDKTKNKERSFLVGIKNGEAMFAFSENDSVCNDI